MCDLGPSCERDETHEDFADFAAVHRLVHGWHLVDFLVFVLVVEHVIMLAKILLE